MGYVGIFAVSAFFKTLFLSIGVVKASRKIHAKMIFKLLHAQTTEFLQRMPIGRIINRFSQDIDALDTKIGVQVDNLNASMFFVLLNIYSVVVGASSLLLLIPTTLFLIIGWITRIRYMKAKREIVRLQAITQSPVVGVCCSSIAGAPIIRALNKKDYFSQKVETLIHENSKNGVISFGLDGWFETRLAIWNLILVLLPSYGMVIYQLRINPNLGSKKLVEIAFFLLRTINFVVMYQNMLSLLTFIETNLVSIERCKAFEEIQSETGYKCIQDDALHFEIPNRNISIPERVLQEKNYPKLFPKGEIQLLNVSAKYPTSSSKVLTSINLHIEPGEKIGIVGRTGAGKSSFIKLFWRSLVPSEGQILIDGQDISQLDLKVLRSQINIISQATNLFEGTIAENIHPQPLTRDDSSKLSGLLIDLGFAADKLQEKGLDFELDTDGSNLSEGEKQILSLVIAIYNKTKILIMDEATSNIDQETEHKFHQKVEEHFHDCTSFIIAHRIQTILDCNRVIVLSEGCVEEFGTVKELLSNEEGSFSQFYHYLKH